VRRCLQCFDTFVKSVYVLTVAMQEVMDRCIGNYRKTTGIELRMAIDPENFLSSELYVLYIIIVSYVSAKVQISAVKLIKGFLV